MVRTFKTYLWGYDPLNCLQNVQQWHGFACGCHTHTELRQNQTKLTERTKQARAIFCASWFDSERAAWWIKGSETYGQARGLWREPQGAITFVSKKTIRIAREEATFFKWQLPVRLLYSFSSLDCRLLTFPPWMEAFVLLVSPKIYGNSFYCSWQ